MEIISNNNITNGSGYSSIDPIPENIPNELKQYNHWVCWKIGVSNGKPTKVPVNPNNGYNAKANDPSTWGTFDQAWSYYCFNQMYGIRGIGYVFGPDDPFVGIDFDKCRNPQTGETESWATQNIGYLNSYAELSPSGTGFHIFIKGILPPGRNRKDRVEMYESNRFFTMTGQVVEGSSKTIEFRQEHLEELHRKVYGEQQTKKEPVTQVTVNTQPLNLSDEELIRRAQASQNGDKFSRLFAGDHSGYPSQSEADLAFCSMLAFWTGKDAYQMDRIFRQSGLMRDKWDRVAYADGRTYGAALIDTAINGATETYSPGHSTGRMPQVDMVAAQEHVQKIIDFSQQEPRKVVLEITQNTEYIGALALVAEQDTVVYENFFQQIKLNKVTTKDIDAIRRVIKGEQGKKKLRLVQPGETQPQTLVKDALPDAPVNDKLILPNGYRLSKQGLIRIELREDSQGNSVPRMIEIASTPILITARTVNIESQNEAVRLTWSRDGKWKHKLVDRGIIATNRTITGLSNPGVPVTDSNSKELVDYLSVYESINLDYLPKTRVSPTLGWQDTSSFLWGNTLIKSGERMVVGVDLEEIDPQYWSADWITFKPEDDGNDQIAKGFKVNGSYDGWITTANRLYPYPKVISAMYFSLGVPFLEILGVPNFVVDWSYPTSTGKTVTLRFAGSCWGDPDETHPEAVVQTWDNTKVGLERIATMLNGIPVILDDTKLAGTGANKDKAAALIANTIYMITKGRGRGRGSIRGLRTRGSWRTILLSSGEQSAVDFTTDGGTRPRVLTLWGLPFGRKDTEIAKFINEIDLQVKQNYGHAGPRVVKFILNNQHQWDLWRNTYQEYRKEFINKAGANEIAIRISDYFAFLATVMPLINAALPELRQDIPIQAIIDNLWRAAISGIEDADQATVALQIVYEWAVRNQAKFFDRVTLDNADKSKPFEPHAGWAGVWTEGRQWKEIAITTGAVTKVLEEAGFEVKAITKTWKDRGWLDVPQKGRGNQRMINDERVSCYCIKRSAIENIHGVQEDAVASVASQIQERIVSVIPKDATLEMLDQLKQEMDQVLSRHQQGKVAVEPKDNQPFNPFGQIQ